MWVLETEPLSSASVLSQGPISPAPITQFLKHTWRLEEHYLETKVSDLVILFSGLQEEQTAANSLSHQNEYDLKQTICLPMSSGNKNVDAANHG